MKRKLTLDLTASLVSKTMVTQENILDMRENYHICKTVTLTGVLTSVHNLGSVRYLQDSTAGIGLYPIQDWSAWEATPQFGDSLSVTGEITEINGFLEVVPTSRMFRFFAQHMPLQKTTSTQLQLSCTWATASALTSLSASEFNQTL